MSYTNRNPKTKRDKELKKLISYRKKNCTIVKKKKEKITKEAKSLIKLTYKEFLKSAYWKKIRNKILKRDNYTCKCGSSSNLHVHHKTYKNHFKEHKHLEDLITLCSLCHKKEHNL